MALITNGSIDSFSATIARSLVSTQPSLGNFRTLSEIGEVTRSIQPAPLEFAVSSTARGLSLKSLKLTQGFEGFLEGLFNPTNEVYFLAWVWDMSGNPVTEYPGNIVTEQSCVIPLKFGQVREFLGSGICLFPARQVTAGMAIRIMIWESDQNTRNFGKAMSEVANTIKASKLNNLLSIIAVAGISTTTIALIKDATIELADLIGQILQGNSDDYVDFYEGYYPVSLGWTPGDESHQGYASEIVLNRFT